MSLLTLGVALAGYVREAALAARFGLSATMDAYFAAIFIPNLVYMVLIAGTLSPVFIPILMQQDGHEDRAQLSETFSVVTNAVLLMLAATIVLGLLTVHIWLPLLFPGFSNITTDIATRLVYIIFPAMIFVAVAGILTAALNGFHKFAVPAAAPVLSSLAVIIAAVWARGNRAIYVVGFATALGFLFQFLFLLPATRRLHIRYRLVLNFRAPAIRKLVSLGAPLLLYLVLANASSFLERNLASQLSAGAVSSITYATRLFAIPANFFAAPVAIVAYPLFVSEAVRENWGDLRNQVSRIIRLVCFLFLPLTLWVVMNSLPLIRVFYERGQFHMSDSVVTARVLMLYGIGILPNAVTVILLRCFYAVQDTLTPLWAEAIDLAFYTATALILTPRFGIAGLAVTRGMTFFLVAGILIFVLWRKRKLLIVDFEFFRFLGRTAIASFAMVAASWMTLHWMQPAFDAAKTPLRLGIICIVMTASAAVFLGAARLLKLDELTHILSTVRELLSGAANVADGHDEIPVIGGGEL